jgi:hypothetical protein
MFCGIYRYNSGKGSYHPEANQQYGYRKRQDKIILGIGHRDTSKQEHDKDHHIHQCRYDQSDETFLPQIYGVAIRRNGKLYSFPQNAVVLNHLKRAFGVHITLLFVVFKQIGTAYSPLNGIALPLQEELSASGH